MILRRHAADARLAGVVRHYRSRVAALGEAVRRVALPARTDVLLEFYFTAPHLLELQADGAREHAPGIAAVGPQTHRRVDLLLSGTLDVFTIQLTPTGLHRLLGVPMTELADAGIDAGALFGPHAITELHDRLAAAPGLAARARLADAFLLARLTERSPADAIVADALTRMHRGQDATAGLAQAAGWSERHFRRVFAAQVGVAPKRYARIVRFEAALAAKAAAPGRDWTGIAHELGWFDQAHMDKDFRAFAGAPPIRLTGVR